MLRLVEAHLEVGSPESTSGVVETCSRYFGDVFERIASIGNHAFSPCRSWLRRTLDSGHAVDCATPFAAETAVYIEAKRKGTFD